MEVGGVATRALELEGDGPGLILLHGWGDSADTWRPLLARLARLGRRAIAVDLPGWFDIVGRDPLLRRLLDVGIPIPRGVAAAAVGQIYRRLAFSAPRAADPDAVRTYAAYHASREGLQRLLASGRRLLLELLAGFPAPTGLAAAA